MMSFYITIRHDVDTLIVIAHFEFAQQVDTCDK